MKFKICFEDRNYEFDGTVDCGNLENVLDDIQKDVSNIEQQGFTVDQGGDDYWYELTMLDDCPDQVAKNFLLYLENKYKNNP